MLYDEFRAMNSDIVLAASGKDQAAIHNGFTESRQFINRSETRFTRFTDTSELADLNRSAGVWFQASDEMFALLELAYHLAVETVGLFNPAILPALKRAGYDRSMDDIRNQSLPEESDDPVEKESTPDQDFRTIQLEPATNSVLLPQGMQIDLGGIAKGWIAEQAAHRLATVSTACAVSAGGDIFLINLPDGEPDWEIGLENPLALEENLAVLHVLPGAVATSSTVKRQWKHNGRYQHHLIDPRSGEPAQTEWLSTTVWAEQAAEAEVYAKVLLIAGPHKADALFKNQTSKAYLAVDKSGWVHGSNNYHEVFHV
jgi:thiamine biosynthesis lipoprotein